MFWLFKKDKWFIVGDGDEIKKSLSKIKSNHPSAKIDTYCSPEDMIYNVTKARTFNKSYKIGFIKSKYSIRSTLLCKLINTIDPTIKILFYNEINDLVNQPIK